MNKKTSSRIKFIALYPTIRFILIFFTYAIFLSACLDGNSDEVDTESIPNTPTSSNKITPSTSGLSIIISEGTVARYLVNEQLARQKLPNDAIGETTQVDGQLIFDIDGTLNSSQSTITVDLTSLKSDSSRRDGFIRANTLETNKFPTAKLVIKDVSGLPWPLPNSGESTFKLIGDMALHGITTELIWDVTAQFRDKTVIGSAKTNFTFDTFNIEIPKVFIVLSVEDNIRLEIDFNASIAGR